MRVNGLAIIRMISTPAEEGRKVRPLVRGLQDRRETREREGVPEQIITALLQPGSLWALVRQVQAEYRVILANLVSLAKVRAIQGR